MKNGRLWFVTVGVRLLVAALAVAFYAGTAAAQSGYSYRRSITIDHTKVPNTDQSNFPISISGTYSYLATGANGGKVQNANGYDIIFTSDAAGSNKLDYEMESYNAATGAASFWVRIPTLSHTTDTVIYMQYGNSAITTSQENKAGVWDSNYQGVWHLTTLADSTTNQYTLAGYNGGSAPTSLAGGKIGGAMSFASASSQNAGISGPNSPNLQIAGSQTWEMWIKSSNLASGLERGPSIFNSGSSVYVALYANAGALTFSTSGVSSSTVVNSGVAPTNNTWFHVVGVYDAGAAKHRIYVNGVKTEVATTGSHTTQNNAMTLGDASDYSSHQYADESLDEVRISNTVRSDDWVATEYNNESSPFSFYAVGPELTIAINVTPAATAINAGQTQQFSAAVGGTPNTAVTWSVSPAGTGSISSSGLYTAPNSVSVPQRVMVTATSVADSTKSTSAKVTISGPATNFYFYRRAITINHAKVPNSDQGNFPLMIAGTFGFLATVANGGDVQNANGYDIIFTSDAAGNNKLDHEIESYNPLTGAVSFWVRIPWLSHSTDTVIYVQYGNNSITSSQENRTGVWDSNYQGVWHLTTVVDSTVNGYSLAGYNGGSAPTSLASGQIGGAMSFASANSQNAGISGPNSPNLQIAGSQTWEMWINSPNLASGLEYGPLVMNSGSSVYAGLYANAGALTFALSGVSSSTVVNSSVAPANNTWFHVVGVYDAIAAAQRIYVNGVKTEVATTAPHTTQSNAMTLADSSDFNTRKYANESLDEVRISNIARSSDWIASEYNNQSSPATFYSMGAEQAESISIRPTVSTLNAGQQQSFTASMVNAPTTGIVWSISPTGAGTIDATGLYTAPSSVSSQQTVSITATSAADSSKSASAAVLLYPTVGGSQQSFSGAVGYSYDSLGRLIAAAAGTGDAALYRYDAIGNILSISRIGGGQLAVFSLTPQVGTPGVPVTFSGSGLNTVTAVSFNGTAASITSSSGNSLVAQVPNGATTGPVTLSGSLGAVTVPFTVPRGVQISPSSSVIQPGQSVSFQVVVSGVSSPQFIWAVNGIRSGNSKVGTIDNNGVYSVPANAANMNVTITATSAADPSLQGLAAVQVQN